jgi:hypothetical protein
MLRLKDLKEGILRTTRRIQEGCLENKGEIKVCPSYSVIIKPYS